MSTSKIPQDLKATHVYDITHDIRFEYNNERHAVRVVDVGLDTVSKWFDPSIVIDLNKFISITAPTPHTSNIDDKRRQVMSKYYVIQFLTKWREKLDDDLYVELMADIRSLIVAAELRFRKSQKSNFFADGMGDKTLDKLIATIIGD